MPSSSKSSSPSTVAQTLFVSGLALKVRSVGFFWTSEQFTQQNSVRSQKALIFFNLFNVYRVQTKSVKSQHRKVCTISLTTCRLFTQPSRNVSVDLQHPCSWCCRFLCPTSLHIEENVLRTAYVCKSKEVTKGCRKLQSQKFHSSYSSGKCCFEGGQDWKNRAFKAWMINLCQIFMRKPRTGDSEDLGRKHSDSNTF